MPFFIDNFEIVDKFDQKNSPLVKWYVCAAYFLISLPEIGVNCVAERSFHGMPKSDIDIDFHSRVNLLFTHLLADTLRVTERDETYVTKLEKQETLKQFLNLDVSIVKLYGPTFEIDDSYSFSYDVMSGLDVDELLWLRDFIDRIQILIISGTCNEDFEEGFRQLSNAPGYNFMNGKSKFNLSKFRTGRVKRILVVYKATAIARFFLKYGSLYEKLIKNVYEWFVRKSELISKILKPSQKTESSSKFESVLEIPNWLELHDFEAFAELTKTFRIFFNNRLSEYRNKYFGHGYWRERATEDLLEEMIIKVDKGMSKSFKDMLIFLRVRKIFFDFLIGNEFKYKKNGWVILTKEMKFLGRMETVVSKKLYINWPYYNCMLDSGPNYRVSFNFRKVGPETEDEKLKKLDMMKCLYHLRHKLNLINIDYDPTENSKYLLGDSVPYLDTDMIHIYIPTFELYTLVADSTNDKIIQNNYPFGDTYKALVQEDTYFYKQVTGMVCELFSMDNEEEIMDKTEEFIEPAPPYSEIE